MSKKIKKESDSGKILVIDSCLIKQEWNNSIFWQTNKLPSPLKQNYTVRALAEKEQSWNFIKKILYAAEISSICYQIFIYSL